jgi:hypothetical protein
MRARQRRESGIALVGAGIWFLALAAMVAIAIEIARLTDTATEVQVAADSGAIGGALALAQGHADQAVARGTTAASNNQADGRAVGAGGVLIEVGHYATDPAANPHFVTPCAGGTDCNAIKATVTVDNVQYIVASLFGSAQTSVQKTAVASAQCQGSASSPLPLAVCQQALANPLGRDDLCIDAPLKTGLKMASAVNACWTTLSAGTGSNVVQSLFPKECGGTATSADRYVILQQSIRLLGTGAGVSNSLWDMLQCCVACQSNHRFTVPVIDCPEAEPCTATGKSVIGFATLDIATPDLISDGSNSTTRCNAGNNYPPGGCTATAPNVLLDQFIKGTQICHAGNGGTAGGANCTNFGNTVAPVLGQLP